MQAMASGLIARGHPAQSLFVFEPDGVTRDMLHQAEVPLLLAH